MSPVIECSYGGLRVYRYLLVSRQPASAWPIALRAREYINRDDQLPADIIIERLRFKAGHMYRAIRAATPFLLRISSTCKMRRCVSFFKGCGRSNLCSCWAFQRDDRFYFRCFIDRAVCERLYFAALFFLILQLIVLKVDFHTECYSFFGIQPASGIGIIFVVEYIF